MTSSSGPRNGRMWLQYVPSARWLAGYQIGCLGSDMIAGLTLAAYAIPVSLAYAALAGLPPQVGIYGYLLGGVGYALLGSSRQLAVGPTSAISLMIAGSVGRWPKATRSDMARSPVWRVSRLPYCVSSPGCCGSACW